MKLPLRAILIITTVSLMISSWANMLSGWEWDRTRQRELSAVGPHVKLISMDIPLTLTSTEDGKYWATIKYDSGMKPEVRRVCFSFSGIGESCFDVEGKDVTSKTFRVSIQVPAGTKKIDCYAEYIRDGKLSRTNRITYYIIILKNSEEQSQKN